MCIYYCLSLVIFCRIVSLVFCVVLCGVFLYGYFRIFFEERTYYMSSIDGFIEGSNTSLAHYGIIAGAFDELGIGELIDELLPKKKAHVITHGQGVKSLVINGLAVDQRGVPLFLQTFSGNESDKKTIVEMIGNLRNNLISPHKVYHLADNAFYTQPNLQEMGYHTLWISRVTNSIKQAKELLATDIPLQPCSDTRYSYTETTSSFAGIQQKWVLYHSNEMEPKKLKTYERNLVKDQEKKIKSLKTLKAREFACENDALAEAENWISKKKKYQFSSLEIYSVSKRSEGKRGRPKKDEVMLKKYRINAEITFDPDMIEEGKKRLGRFILATNDETLDSDTLLTEYKNQYKVERGFRFLKDKSFRIGEVFLKKESRIQALAMIMVLCLFVYSLVEFELRRKLKESKETITSQTNKQTENPTLKWVFFGFRRVRELRFMVNGEMVITLTNMLEELWKVLRLLGKDYEKYYA